MSRWFVRRIVHTVFLLGLVSLVAFGLLALAPVDPARMSLSGGSGMPLDERDVEAKRRELGLDRPLWERYLHWGSAVLRLDLGQSYVSKQPVSQLLIERLPASIILAALAVGVSVMLAVPLGILAAQQRGTWLDLAIGSMVLVGASLPGFWLALLLLWLFAAELRWLPALGSLTPRGMLLPMLILAIGPMARLTRLVRAAMRDVLQQEFITVARAKGLPWTTIVRRHALPHIFLSILTVIGLDFATLLAESAVVEWVFAWPGIGRLGADAALAGDLPVVVGFVLVIGAGVTLVNLIVDISSSLLDPRQRRERYR